jgi:hypothetical protein
MYVERALGEWAEGADQIRKEEKAGSEVGVGDVEVIGVGEGVYAVDVGGDVGEIRGPQGDIG